MENMEYSVVVIHIKFYLFSHCAIKNRNYLTFIANMHI